VTRSTDAFTSLLDTPYRWPRHGDRLLRHTADWNRGVDFEQHALSREAFVWSGYLRAGAALIEACDQNPRDRHFLIYPILFNYRHGLELAMKWIISRYESYASVAISETNHHDLWKLWQAARDIIVDLGGKDDALPVVEQVAKELHDVSWRASATSSKPPTASWTQWCPR